MKNISALIKIRSDGGIYKKWNMLSRINGVNNNENSS